MEPSEEVNFLSFYASFHFSENRNPVGRESFSDSWFFVVFFFSWNKECLLHGRHLCSLITVSQSCESDVVEYVFKEQIKI